MIVIELPFPPSANAYIRHADGHRHYFTPEAKAFRQEVAWRVKSQRVRALVGRLAVMVQLHGPNRRAYDIDNRVKPLLDALMHAGCFVDDEAIDRLQVERGAIVKGGKTVVRIEVCASVPQQDTFHMEPRDDLDELFRIGRAAA